jgi:aryl-alcohol dehydrogenase-like predicted oxidoreductase
MMFGNTNQSWRAGADEAASRKVYDAYRAAGGNFVDTANVYGDSEIILGRFIKEERDAIVLASKFTLETDARDPNSGGSHRKSLRGTVEASLQRLGTDHLDVLWVHAWDQRTPVEETLRALDDVVRAGKVLAVGVSNTPAWVVSRAVAIAELRGWSAYCGLQVEYSLARRTAEREMLPMARALGLAVTAWAPLARGVLAGKNASPRDEAAARAVKEVAAATGSSPARVALAWLRHRDAVPVVGATKVEQMQDCLGAVDVTLEHAHLEQLDSATKVELGYPHEFLQFKAERLGPV